MNTPPTVYGDERRHYSARCVPAQKSDQPLTAEERLVLRLLEEHDADLVDRVRRSYQQWNQIVRDYLRSDTALKLSVGDDYCSVPVKIRDGLPPAFASVVREFPDPAVWRLMLNRVRIEEASKGLGIVLDCIHPQGLFGNPGFVHFVQRTQALWQANKKGSPVPGVPADAELMACKDFMDLLGFGLEHQDLLQKLKGINEDVLGAYFFRVPEIHLYWMPIGIVAGLLSVPADSLAFVVLTHELAHAYTHVGRDIDGQRWETEHFAETELGVVEGLAQFYTHAICAKMAARYPSGLVAFDRLLTLQSPAYTGFARWFGDNDKTRTGEAVRFAMIQARSLGIRKEAEFRGQLLTAKTKVTGGNAQASSKGQSQQP